MIKPWTAEDVKAVFRRGQETNNPVGTDRDTMSHILEWMNSEDPDWINVSGMMYPRRPGALLFMTLTEHVWFAPDTPAQDDFLLVNLKWEQMVFYVFSIPSTHRPHLDVLAPKCGVRLADGIPTMFTGDGVKHFPVRGRNTFNLENIKDHPAYKQALTSDNEMFKHEDMLIAKIFDKTLDLKAYETDKKHA